MARSFKQRLAALEALEADAEQERAEAEQAEHDAGLPPLGTLSDAVVLYEAVLALRSWRLFADPPAQPASPFRLTVHPMLAAHVARWYAALAARAQPLIDALPRPVILLTPWEVEDALGAIDAGRIQVAWITGNVGRRSCFRLEAAPLAAGDKELDATIVAVNHAVRRWASDAGLPQVGSWELRELGDWRGWLAALLADAI